MFDYYNVGAASLTVDQWHFDFLLAVLVHSNIHEYAYMYDVAILSVTVDHKT